ncbi:glutamate decarboxylase [Truncatella angustata]|uniref:Glutamate decarboxylase n=1 Tax=Truncatella angustata TaxID=152316 RepID=A0A9P8UFN1_9PEZI|nr:glutamate decarboxylase [Truncatella angustata]KAH6649110.1 glutamate decarboxylase [Truncatella angustata]
MGDAELIDIPHGWDPGTSPGSNSNRLDNGIVGQDDFHGLPRNHIPEDEMPPEIAVRKIQHDLAMDGTPALNLGSFVTTHMDEHARELIVDGLSKNFVHYESYPITADIHNRCLNMIANLFHAPDSGRSSDAVGTSTIGSSEAILLATLAMKKRWVNRQKVAGKDYSAPNLIMSSTIQVCWKKAARYFDIEERYVFCARDCYIIDPQAAVELVDENTIGICSILGTTYTGEYDDIKAINDLLIERDLDVPIHVDAASGGFVAPFVEPDLVWDFRLEKVVSINVSGHKYGLVYAGIGWAIWRSAEYLPKELIFEMNYLGTEQTSVTLNFSRSASPIISQYYRLISLGMEGYRRVMVDLFRVAEYLALHLEEMGTFILLCKKRQQRLPLIAFRLDMTNNYQFDEFTLSHKLRQQGGWVVPAYTMAPHNEDVKILRVVVREDFSKARCDAFIVDLHLALHSLNMQNTSTSFKVT